MTHSISKFEHYRLQGSLFLVVGIVIGTLLAIQIRSDTYVSNEGISKTLQIERSLLQSFTVNHEDLSVELQELQKKRKELEVVTEKNSSKKLQNQLKLLRENAGIQPLAGSGIRITIEDGVAGGSYLTAADMRDIVNVLFLQGAQAITVNGARVSSLMPIRDAFDTVFLGNRQVSSPFTIEAIGNYEALFYGVKETKIKKIKVVVERVGKISIPSYDSLKPFVDTKLLVPDTLLSL